MAAAITTTRAMPGMAIRNERDNDRMIAAHVWVRTFVIMLGLAAVAWGGILLPRFWDQGPLDRTAAEILQGHTFKAKSSLLAEARLAEEAQQTSVCNPTDLHDAVILRLGILNEAIAAADQSLIKSSSANLYNAIQKALFCGPANSFVWLTLVWLDVRKHGFEPHDANYLRLSYDLGPNEGWIGLWRARIAIALFQQLPPDLSERATGEFVKLVNTGRLYRETAQIFGRAVPAAQVRILDELKTATPIARQNFARTLYDEGLDAKVPDTEIPGLHSWER